MFVSNSTRQFSLCCPIWKPNRWFPKAARRPLLRYPEDSHPALWLAVPVEIHESWTQFVEANLRSMRPERVTNWLQADLLVVQG
jgi:hypothetical protein